MVDLLGEKFTEVIPNVFLLKKWNWNYAEAEAFQLKLIEEVRENPSKIFLIICNHPACYTLGRGLQKIKSPDSIPLVHFEPMQAKNLKYPLYEIKRGGGITFHYPGQIVCYPILNLNSLNIAVFDLMLKILNFSKECVEELFHLNQLVIDPTLLGLWKKEHYFNYKIASIGLAVSRFITYHGLAINLIDDDAFFRDLSSIHPCGLSSEFYRPIENLINKKMTIDDLDAFADKLTFKFISFISENHLSKTLEEKSLNSI